MNRDLSSSSLLSRQRCLLIKQLLDIMAWKPSLLTTNTLYFYEKTVSQMTTFFRDEFWTRHVMQVADSEKCIRHSLVALSSYHESFSSPKPASRNQFALRHYNMSIGGILKSLRTADNAHIHLMSCILFICIEVRAVVADIKARKLRSHLIGIARTHIDGSASCQSGLQNSPRTKQKPTGQE